ncbi:MAG: 2-dehydro-3-deoxy-6-phosphogalactonate aldolase [Lysobacteraceae bacterium]|nr:MAG: 2-dehydro-3-deoxy-6-phosphogalactonate aldolase [Xanthomonadaceae bacterium]
MDLHAHLPLIAILRGVTPDEIDAHVSALIECGIGLIEIPTNSPDWQASVESALELAGDRAVIGAGTVLTLDHVEALAGTGGRLMVTPNSDPQIIAEAVARGLFCATGFATASEAFAAIKAGAQALKLFPAAHFGPGYVRALKAVLPAAMPLFAVGGITPANLPDFLAAGCHGAGLGSDLYAVGQTPETTRARALDFVQAFRGHRP